MLLIQHPKMIALAFDDFTVWRVIYLDGRPHPADIADYPDFMGHSIGRWEGTTLVVDTVGIDLRSWLDTAGHEHSEQASRHRAVSERGREHHLDRHL